MTTLPSKLNLQKGSLAVSQTPCETCMSIVEDAEDYIASPATQDVVVTFLQENLCSLLPKDSERTCSQEARVLVAQAVASMEQHLTPDMVCKYMGTCGTGALVKDVLDYTEGSGWPVECPVCKLVMTNIVQRLKDPERRKEIYQAALAACDDIAEPDAVAKCRYDVEQMFTSLDALLDDMDAGRACQVLQFCGDADKRVAPPAGVAVLRQISHRLGEVNVNDPDSCEACKSVVGEAVAILMDPDTQKEVMDFAKQGCEAFDEFKDQCQEYVDMYGPMAIGILVSYLQPNPFCSRIGYCSDGALTV